MVSVSFSDIDSFIEQKYQLFGNKHDFLSKKIILANMALKIIQVTLALFKNLHKLKASLIGVIIYNYCRAREEQIKERTGLKNSTQRIENRETTLKFCTQCVQNSDKHS